MNRSIPVMKALINTKQKNLHQMLYFRMTNRTRCKQLIKTISTSLRLHLPPLYKIPCNLDRVQLYISLYLLHHEPPRPPIHQNIK